MGEPQSDYWAECISEAFEDAGIVATAKQIETVADSVRLSHENYGMAFPTPSGPSQIQKERGEALKALEKERAKIQCSECGGRGHYVVNGPLHSATGPCHKCRGEGRINP